LLAVPLSARYGDNVISRSARTPVVAGPPLLDYLETIDVETELETKPFRHAGAVVNRPNLDFRGFSGTIVSGRIAPGDEIVAANSGRRSRVSKIFAADREL